MITVTNTQRLVGLDFESYKLLPQFNFSFLKSQRAGVATEVKETDKIVLGKLVDDMRTGGKPDMAHRLYPYAKEIAAYLHTTFGNILDCLVPQVSYTGVMQFKGFRLAVKGRSDFDLQKRLIVDLKVTSDKNLSRLIDFMRYPDQLFNYAKLAQAQEAYLLIYSRPLKKAELIPVPVGDRNAFWEDKIIKFGTPI